MRPENTGGIWKKYYYDKLGEFLREKGIPLSPEEYLENLGRKLYTKITEVIQAEIEIEKSCDQ